MEEFTSYYKLLSIIFFEIISLNNFCLDCENDQDFQPKVDEIHKSVTKYINSSSE